MLLIEYPKCSTCQKANKYLKSKNFNYKFRNIVIDKLNVNELDRLIQKSGKDINKFFNTSGLKYKELKLKDKIKTMSYEKEPDEVAMLDKQIEFVADVFHVSSDDIWEGLDAATGALKIKHIFEQILGVEELEKEEEKKMAKMMKYMQK